VLNNQGKISYWNKAAEKIFGYNFQEVAGKEMHTLLMPQHYYKAFKDGFSKLKKTEEGPVFGKLIEFEALKKGGAEIPVELSVSATKLKGEWNAIVIVRDITDRKEAEEKLTIEKAYLDFLYESAQEAVIMTDKEGRAIRVNKEFTRLFGFILDEIRDRPIDEYLVPESHLKEAEAITKKVAGGGKVKIESIRQHRNGTLIDVSILGAPIEINGEVVAVYGIYRDITERKRALEQIRASLKEKDVMLREIHHRVKNNLQIIASLLRLQARGIKDKAALEKFKISQDRIKSMALVHERLYQSEDLSRIDFSDYIKRITSHLLSIYSLVAPRINMTLDVEKVYFDINKAIPCGLIINELLTNIMKHAFSESEKGEIVVKMDDNKQGKITFIVKDNGKGFPKELDFRNTNTLGLQLVNDLVKQLKGNIELDRKGGTTWKITC
jgi:PAS domain S-box-containing protein